MRNGRIAGTGSYVPETIWTNEDLEKMVATSDAWIRERTGIAARHIAGGETVALMAAQAAREALKNAGICSMDLDLILVGTSSAESIFPNTACLVQEDIGASHAACLDVSAACTGFLSVYELGQMYIRTGKAEKVLVIGADALSRLVDWEDRGTCILFGDGAGAVILKAEEMETNACEILHADGEKGASLTCGLSYPRYPSDSAAPSDSVAPSDSTALSDPSAKEKRKERCSEKNPMENGTCVSKDYQANEERIQREYLEYLRMDGRAVFQFALSRVPEVIREVLEKAEVSVDEVDLFVLHQANSRILDGVARRLQVPKEKVPRNIASYGNTCAASIPILLDELNRSGELQRGQKIVLSGFGAGLIWGAAYFIW